MLVEVIKMFMNFEEKISVAFLAIFGFNNIVELNQILETILLGGSILAGSMGLYWRYLKHKREQK